MKKILFINGPNLNMLGKRQVEIYGSYSLQDIEAQCLDLAKKIGLDIEFFQSNSEGEIVDKIQNMYLSNNYAGLIINAAAYTHTSIAIADALAMVGMPKIELHISNIYKRENFRRKSFVSAVVDASMCGFGAEGYVLALQAIKNMLKE